jgi:hypothetical protein
MNLPSGGAADVPMSWLKRLFKREPPPERGFVHFDFESTFPHVFWTSNWGVDDEFPDGIRYKVFSVRREPDGDFEVVLLHELRDGTKEQRLRWLVPPGELAKHDGVIRMLEQKFSVRFERADLSDVRTLEELETRARQLGWEVE